VLKVYTLWCAGSDTIWEEESTATLLKTTLSHTLCAGVQQHEGGSTNGNPLKKYLMGTLTFH
jgi:hypothetical protein